MKTKTHEELQKELKALEAKKVAFLDESKNAFLLYHRNQAKQNYKECLLDIAQKKSEMKNV